MRSSSIILQNTKHSGSMSEIIISLQYGGIGSRKEATSGVKIAHSPGALTNKSLKECKETTNTSYTWGCYHVITNHTTYIFRGTTSTVYFV